MIEQVEGKTIGTGTPQKKKRSVWPYIIIGAVVLNLTLIGVCAKVGCDQFLNKVGDSAVYIEDMHTGARNLLSAEKGMMSLPRFSPDGKKIFYILRESSDGKKINPQLRQYDLAEKKDTLYLEDNMKDISLTTFIHPRTGQVLCESSGGTVKDLWLYSPGDGKRIKITDAAVRAEKPSLSPDGKWVLYENRDLNNDLFLVPSSGGTKRRLTNASSFLNMPKEAAWSPDSLRIAFISLLDLVVIDLSGNVLSRVDLTGLNNHKRIMFDPLNNAKVYVVARKSDDLGMTFEIYTVNIPDKQLSVFKSQRSFWEFNYGISPDGKTMVYSAPRK